MAKENNKQHTENVSEDIENGKSSSMRFAKNFFYIAPLIGLAFGIVYLLQNQNQKTDEISFSKEDLKKTVIQIIEKSKTENGEIDIKKVENLIELKFEGKNKKQ
jgi:hypothetical protein